VRFFVIAALLVSMMTIGSGVAQASTTCGVSGGHTLCVTVPNAPLTGPAAITVTNSANNGTVIATWIPSGKPAINLSTKSDPSAQTNDYSFVWPTQKYLDATGVLRLQSGSTGSSQVNVPVTLSNGNSTDFQHSPNDWATFLPAPWTQPTDPVVAAVGDGPDGGSDANAVAESIALTDPDLFLFLGDIYENGTFVENLNHYGQNSMDGGPGTLWGQMGTFTQPTLGNHEAANTAAWQDYFHGRPLYMSFRFGNVLFFDLASSGASMVAGSAQYNYVQSVLTSTTEPPPPCIVAFWHIPALGKSTIKSSELAMWNLLTQNGGDLVLNGHVHTMIQYKPLNGQLQLPSAADHGAARQRRRRSRLWRSFHRRLARRVVRRQDRGSDLAHPGRGRQRWDADESVLGLQERKRECAPSGDSQLRRRGHHTRHLGLQSALRPGRNLRDDQRLRLHRLHGRELQRHERGVGQLHGLRPKAKTTATAPQGATTGKISVTAPGGTASSSTDFTVSPSPTPTISGFSPPSGPGGTSVTINGTGFTGATGVSFNGTSVGSGNFTIASDIQITATVPQGATTGQISVTTPGGTATSSTDFTVTPLIILPFDPDADTFVRSDNPTAHPGTKTSLSVDNSPIKHGLLRFTVSGVGSGTIQSVTLRLFSLDSSDKGGDFYWVPDNSWQEKIVDWNTEPAADPTLRASLGAVSVNTWYEVDLSSLVTGDGTYSIRIASTSSNGADYSTKEGAAGLAPQLVVAFVQ
jgi:hypothetical protein